MYRCALLFVLPLLWVGSGTAGDVVAKKDLKLFQGTWQPVFARNPEGHESSKEELETFRLVVNGNEFTLTGKDFKVMGSFTMDASKTPKTVDFLLANGKDPDEKFLGIYQIEGAIRKSCFALPKKDRPRVLRPSEKGYLIFEWKLAAP